MIRYHFIMRNQRQASSDIFFWMMVTLTIIASTAGGSLGAFAFNHPRIAVAGAVLIAAWVGLFILRRVRRKKA
jgi:lipopolysaccharide export LptBFGC system permease protein LptF